WRSVRSRKSSGKRVAWNPHLLTRLPPPNAARIGVFSWPGRRLILAVHAPVGSFDKFKQISVHLAGVGQHHHVRNGRTGPAHARFRKPRPGGLIPQIETEPQLGGIERDGGKLTRCAKREVAGLGSDGKAWDSAADFGLQH